MKIYFIKEAYEMGRENARASEMGRENARASENSKWPMYSPEGKAYRLGQRCLPLPPLENLL